MGSNSAAQFAAAASSFIGVPFRLHGRDPHTGLDCVGLVAASLRAAGHSPIVPARYSLRNRAIEPLLSFAKQNGFDETSDGLAAGDLLLCISGPAQYHLVIAANGLGDVVHAHAGLRRVVRSPAPIPCPPVQHWRLCARSGD